VPAALLVYGTAVPDAIPYLPWYLHAYLYLPLFATTGLYLYRRPGILFMLLLAMCRIANHTYPLHACLPATLPCMCSRSTMCLYSCPLCLHACCHTCLSVLPTWITCLTSCNILCLLYCTISYIVCRAMTYSACTSSCLPAIIYTALPFVIHAGFPSSQLWLVLAVPLLASSLSATPCTLYSPVLRAVRTNMQCLHGSRCSTLHVPWFIFIMPFVLALYPAAVSMSLLLPLYQFLEEERTAAQVHRYLPRLPPY